MEVQYISLNMTPTGVNPCFHISQYDVGRMLGFIVHSGGATVDLDTYTCTIEGTRNDGTAITSAVATTDNIGTFEVTPTMSNKADKYKCQLVIVDENSKRIASLPFDMEVIKAAMDENSEVIEEDASLYQQYTQQVQSAIAKANTDIQAEKNARIVAVNAEATTRANAITAEATARANADTILQTNINNLASIVQNNKPYTISIEAFSSLPQTITDSKIKSTMKAFNVVLSNPSAQTSDWIITTLNGSMEISGTINGSTSMILELVECRTT